MRWSPPFPCSEIPPSLWPFLPGVDPDPWNFAHPSNWFIGVTILYVLPMIFKTAIGLIPSLKVCLPVPHPPDLTFWMSVASASPATSALAYGLTVARSFSPSSVAPHSFAGDRSSMVIT